MQKCKRALRLGSKSSRYVLFWIFCDYLYLIQGHNLILIFIWYKDWPCFWPAIISLLFFLKDVVDRTAPIESKFMQSRNKKYILLFAFFLAIHEGINFYVTDPKYCQLGRSNNIVMPCTRRNLLEICEKLSLLRYAMSYTRVSIPVGWFSGYEPERAKKPSFSLLLLKLRLLSSFFCHDALCFSFEYINFCTWTPYGQIHHTEFDQTWKSVGMKKNRNLE